MKYSGIVLLLTGIVALACLVQGEDQQPRSPFEVLTATRSEAMKIPTAQRSCNNGDCNFICVLLGYYFGICHSDGWCYCYA